MKNGNYKIVVSGILPFMQDLIYWRLLPQNQVQTKYAYYDPDAPKSFNISAPCVMLLNQIENGSITAPLWEVITKLASSNDMKSIKGLLVVSAVYW